MNKKEASINEKLFNLQQEIGTVSKDATNPFYKSKYFDINSLIKQLQPLLKKHRLLLLQPIEEDMVVSKLLCIDGGGGVVSGLKLPVITDPQKLGSAITYFRRYTLQSLLGLQAEDDDGNHAAKKTVIIPSEKLNKCKNLAELQATFLALTRTEQTAMESLKNQLKTTLNGSN